MLTEIVFCHWSSTNISIDNQYYNRFIQLGRPIFPVKYNGAALFTITTTFGIAHARHTREAPFAQSATRVGSSLLVSTNLFQVRQSITSPIIVFTSGPRCLLVQIQLQSTYWPWKTDYLLSIGHQPRATSIQTFLLVGCCDCGWLRNDFSDWILNIDANAHGKRTVSTKQPQDKWQTCQSGFQWYQKDLCIEHVELVLVTRLFHSATVSQCEHFLDATCICCLKLHKIFFSLGGGGGALSSNVFTIWWHILISGPPRVFRRLKRHFGRFLISHSIEWFSMARCAIRICHEKRRTQIILHRNVSRYMYLWPARLNLWVTKMITAYSGLSVL